MDAEVYKNILFLRRPFLTKTELTLVGFPSFVIEMNAYRDLLNATQHFCINAMIRRSEHYLR